MIYPLGLLLRGQDHPPLMQESEIGRKIRERKLTRDDWDRHLTPKERAQRIMLEIECGED